MQMQSKLAALTGLYFLTMRASFAAANANFTDPHFSGSGNCSNCHDNLRDTQNNDISIVKDWSSSMMANASKDPYWKAKVASELHRNPNLSDKINDKCSRCHTPMANEAAKKAGVAPEILGNGFLNPSNPYYDHALDGVRLQPLPPNRRQRPARQPGRGLWQIHHCRIRQPR